MRGANINFIFPFNGFTPLHWAIEEGVNSKIVKFLLKNDAYEHAVDNNGLDCCEKSLLNQRYHDISRLNNQYCIYD
jgi:ankyrin repeat protein